MRGRFARTFDSLEAIFGFAEEFFRREGIDERHRFAVNFALEEIFTNMDKYNANNSNEIQIDLERAYAKLLVTLTDFDVEPFDVTQVGEVRTDQPLEGALINSPSAPSWPCGGNRPGCGPSRSASSAEGG